MVDCWVQDLLTFILQVDGHTAFFDKPNRSVFHVVAEHIRGNRDMVHGLPLIRPPAWAAPPDCTATFMRPQQPMRRTREPGRRVAAVADRMACRGV